MTTTRPTPNSTTLHLRSPKVQPRQAQPCTFETPKKAKVQARCKALLFGKSPQSRYNLHLAPYICL